MAEIKRQTAYKIKISDILSAQYFVRDDWSPNYVLVSNKPVSRVNLIGMILTNDSEDKKIMIDDGSSSISVRVFENQKMFLNFNVGDFVLIIGRPKEYAQEKYILCESIKKIDKNWLILRKKEWDLFKKLDLGDSLEQLNQKPIVEEEKIYVEEKIKESAPKSTPQKIIDYLKVMDKGNGVEIEEIIKSIGDCEAVIEMMIKRGDVFENKSGRIKIL